MKNVVKKIIVYFTSAVVVAFLGACSSEGGDSSSTPSVNTSDATKQTCINDYYQKNDATTGFAFCIDDIDESVCNEITDEDETYGVDAFMIASSCLDAGFPKDPYDQLDGKDVYMQLELYKKDKTAVVATDNESLFPTVDEEALVNEVGKDVVETGTSDAKVSVKPLDGDASLLVNSSDVLNSDATTSEVLLSSSLAQSKNLQTDKLLYIDNVFQGVINSITDTGSGIKVGLSSVDNIDEVYSQFDIEMRNDSLLSSVQRSIKQQKIHGRYDANNSSPLRFSVKKKSVKNSRGFTNDEIVLRVDIPKGYHVPIKPRSVSCDFSDLECSMTLSGKAIDKLDLGKKYEESGLTFSTEGSYLEIGLGTYIRAHYDKNVFSKDAYDFMVAQSGYFKSNMKVNIAGELSSDWSTELKLMNDFDIEIVHPYSAIVKTSVAVAPVITFGVEGKVNGSITASSYVERGGEIRFMYDSTEDIHRVGTTLKYTPKNMNKDALNVDVTAEAHAYIFPNLLMIPNLKFLRINKPLTFVYARSGVKLDNAIEGKIAKGFVVENSTEQDSKSAQASITTTLAGLVQGRWMVRLGGIDFYHSKEYSDIYKTGSLEILQWKAQLLSKPKILLNEKDGKKVVSFSSDDSDKIKENLYFYYTIAPKNESQYDIDVATIESHKPLWRVGDAPIEVNENSIIKVRSVLYNKDISSSLWSWGTSVSEQTTSEVQNMTTPSISPSSQSFEGSLTITLSQAQDYDIYYSIDGGAYQKYLAPFSVDKTVTISAVAKAMIDGKEVVSESVSTTYTKCESGETLADGVCVVNDSGNTSDTNSSDVSWENWPNPEICPMYNADAVNSNLIQDHYIGTTWCSYYSTNGQLEMEIIDCKDEGDDLFMSIGCIASNNGITKLYNESGCLTNATVYSNGEAVKHFSNTCD